MVTFTILILLIIIVGVLMAMAILMQNPKGSGLSGAFGGAGASFGTMLGVRHASDILQKATWWLAGIFAVLILVLNLVFLPKGGEVQESAIQRASKEQPMQSMPQGQAPARQAPTGQSAQPAQAPAGQAPASQPPASQPGK